MLATYATSSIDPGQVDHLDRVRRGRATSSPTATWSPTPGRPPSRAWVSATTWWPSVDCPDSTLAPGASETCTGSYTVTQADVDNGSVTNTASASATAPDPHTVDVEPVVGHGGRVRTRPPSLTWSSRPRPHSYSTAGQVITYSYKVTNTGTETLRTSP